MDKYFLGIDLGSSYTKFIAVDGEGNSCYSKVIPTLSRHRNAFFETLAEIEKQFTISTCCATGYGRNNYKCDLRKTELISASVGVSALYPIHKCIIDIGGEDVKVIESGPGGELQNFYMNDKCSAGTGAFITEIAEKAELDISEMSDLARNSTANKAMNSFCTVFAKTEILGWKFSGVPIEDIAQGIYLSIVDRIGKMPIRSGLPVYLCGGVIAYHPYLGDLLTEKLDITVRITSNPLYVVALGAALLAKQAGMNKGIKGKESHLYSVHSS